MEREKKREVRSTVRVGSCICIIPVGSYNIYMIISFLPCSTSVHCTLHCTVKCLLSFFLVKSSRWLVSLRSYKTYGTMCSAIICFRRLSTTSSGADFFSPYGSESLPPPYSLAFMRMAYVEVLVRKTADAYLKRVVDYFTGQIIKIALGSAVFLFMASAALYTAEGLGDHHLLASSIREGEFINEWHMLSAVYWAIVTMTTVGYGDMYPTSMYGKVLAMGVIVLGISFLGDVIGRLGDLRKTKRLGGEYYRPRLSNRRHIVICGPIDKTMIEELLAQLFNDSIKHVWDLDIGGLEVVIMVPKEVYDPDVRRWLARTSGVYDARVSYLSGDIISSADAARARLQAAAACFIFPSAYSGAHEDEETVMRAVSTHQRYGSRVMLYIMLHSTKLKGQLIHARIPRDRILCLDQIKFKLAASAAAVKGSANLLLNLLTFTTLKESRQRIFGGAAEYASGTETEEIEDADADDEEAKEEVDAKEVEVAEKESGDGKVTTATHISTANAPQRSGFLRGIGSFSKVKKSRKSSRRATRQDPNIELHIKGATQQFLEYQHPVSGVLVGMRFSAVARDLYRQRRYCAANGEAEYGDAEEDCEDSDSHSDGDNEHRSGRRVSQRRAGLFHRRSIISARGRPEGKEKDDTPVLLCGLHTTDSNGDKRLMMASRKSYRLQAGDRLFMIADNLEEVTKGMIALRSDYVKEERRRKKHRKESVRRGGGKEEGKNHLHRPMESIDIDDSILRTQAERQAHNQAPRRVNSSPGSQSESRSRRSLRHLSSESSLSDPTASSSATGMSTDPGLEGYYSFKWKGHSMFERRQQRGDYARKQLLSTWLGESDRRDYLEAIMYPTMSVPVVIQPKEQLPRTVVEQCRSEIESLQRCLEEIQNAADGDADKKSMVMREVEKTVNALSFQVRKASHGGSATTCHVSAMRKLESEAIMSKRHADKHARRTFELLDSIQRGRHGEKKKNKKMKKRMRHGTRDVSKNRHLLSLENFPLSDARQFIRFKLRAPLKSRLRDHVVICNCNLVTDGHLVIEYFAAKGMDKLLFLCTAKPPFSTWGHLVTMREDCEVYFVVGDVTDVAALQNCNIAEAAAMILLFPKAHVSQGGGLAGSMTNVGSATGVDGLEDEDILEVNTDRNQRQDQATKLVEKHYLFKQDEHACDIQKVPAYCALCEYGSQENCRIDRCQTHEECRNCSDHFQRHTECRRHFNPRLMLSLITEMSRQQGISGDMAYNRSEAAGRLFSELDFVSVLAVRFHFKHFITLAFRAIESVRQREVHADWYATRQHTYGEMLLKLLREHGIIVVGLLRFPHLGASPLVLTNPPPETELVQGDQFYYYNGSMSLAEEEAQERHEEVVKEERKRRERRTSRRQSRRLSKKMSAEEGVGVGVGVGGGDITKTGVGEEKEKTASGDSEDEDSADSELSASDGDGPAEPRPRRHLDLLRQAGWGFIAENRARKHRHRYTKSQNNVSSSLMLQMRAMQHDTGGGSGRLSPMGTPR